MNTAPHGTDAAAAQPLMPVRRLHNFVYCPRLFYFQWVENLFEENGDTIAGSAAHRQVDAPSRLEEEKRVALAENLPQGSRIRSLHLSSENLGLTGIMDVVEGGEDGAELVDYKKGSARRMPDGSRAAKEYDAVQVAAQALLLKEEGVHVASAAIYYAEDRRRVPVLLSEELFQTTLSSLAEARETAKRPNLPPPLEDDPRCLYCSAYPICLPRESSWWARTARRSEEDPQLHLRFAEPLPDADEADPDLDDEKLPPRPPHDDGEVLVVQTAGAQVGQRGGEFTVSVKKEVLRKLPMHQVRSIYLYGAVQLTAQAAQTALELNVDVAYFAPSGRFLGMLRGLPQSGIDARVGQYKLFVAPEVRLRLAREIVRAKIHNQRVMLMRNGEVSPQVRRMLASAREAAARAQSIEEILGIEGGAALIYFEQFGSMLKGSAEWRFDFRGRNRRPPRDPVNALLSLGYSMLSKELCGMCHAVGLDPFLGFYHQPRYGRPALALDLMEEFRPLIADSVAISLINRGEIDRSDFVQSARGTFLNEKGRRRFWEAWFRRMDAEVSHPEFEYRMTYRRMMEVQARQMWRFARGEAIRYHAFTTR